MKSKPFVVIIVSNYNGASILYKGKSILFRCLESLRKTTYNNYKVIVTDAHSPDKSKELVPKFKEIEFIDVGHKAAFSENNNFAIKYAKAKYNPDYYLLLNNDVIITDKNWLEKLVNTAEKYKAGIVGCQLLYPNGNIQHAGMLIGYYGGRNRGRGERYTGQYNKIEEMNSVTFAVVLINREVIEKIGLLDENFINSYEDVDYCIRAKEANFKIIYSGKVKLLHLESFTTRKFPKIESFYYYQRNFIYFMKKHPKIFNLKNKILGFLVYFFASIFSIEGENRKRSIFSIRLKDKPIERLKLSIKAFKDAQKLQTKS